MINSKGNQLVLSLEKRLTCQNFKIYKNKLTSAIAKTNKNFIILDCQRLEYIDCAGLDLILSLYKNLEDDNQLILKNINSDYIHKFIELTQLDKLVKIS